MSALYTFDIFTTLDGYGSYTSAGDWGGYWGKQGPEFLSRRLSCYQQEQRMVFGATTFREMTAMHGATDENKPPQDAWIGRMRELPITVISSTLQQPLAWTGATLEHGDAVEVVARLKAESNLPLRSHGSLSLNRSLLAAGLVDQIQVTIFPVISSRTGDGPIFLGMEDFDLDLLESRTLDGRMQELMYRPTRHK